MKNILLVLWIVVILITSCTSEKKRNFFHSEKIEGYKLNLVDTIIIKSPKSVIGAFQFMGKFGKYFYLSDHSNSKLHLFNEEFELVRSIGREGKGPNEFTKVPIVIKGGEKLKIFDMFSYRIHNYDGKFNYINLQKLPEGIEPLPEEPIYIKDNIIFSAQFSTPLGDDYFRNYTALIACDTNMENKEGVMNWDEVYNDNEYKGAARQGIVTKITPATNQHFFAIQENSYLIHQIDDKLNTVKIFGIPSSNYRFPVKGQDFNKIQRSREFVINIASQQTQSRKICYDKENNFLYVNFYNHSLKALKTRNNDFTDKYLQVYDMSFNCILDTKIEGDYLFSADGYVYILSKELDDRIILTKFKVVKE